MGTARQYVVPEFEGCLSVKTVVEGTAHWRTTTREYVVNENSYLVLNDRQLYTLTIDAARSVTTFCIFFERGFVEDVFRNGAIGTSKLLAAPDAGREMKLVFREQLETHESPVLGLLRRLRLRILNGELSQWSLVSDLYAIAAALVRHEFEIESSRERISALRLSTREELFKRVLRGRDFLLSSLDQQVRLKDVAAAACLSEFHFHRVFCEVFGATPQKYLVAQRLERSAHLLRTTNRSITEISLDCGFQSPGTFSSLFSKHFSAPPSKFRRDEGGN